MSDTVSVDGEVDGTELEDSLKPPGWPARWTLGRQGGKIAADGQRSGGRMR